MATAEADEMKLRRRFSPQKLASVIFVRIPYFVTGTLVLVAIAVNFANVVARYVFASAIFWTEEVLVFLMLWSVFLAAVTIAFNGDHINMDLFFERFSPRWKQTIRAAIAVAFILCATFVAVQSWQVVSLHVLNGTRSVAAGVPMAVPHAALLVGFSMMAIAVAYRFRAYLRGTLD
jgi:TRAP-type C4-dicarboxylate transport system permease small subunit